MKLIFMTEWRVGGKVIPAGCHETERLICPLWGSVLNVGGVMMREKFVRNLVHHEWGSAQVLIQEEGSHGCT